MARWIIIGGAGFTGTNLTKKIINKLKINPSNIVICDLENTFSKVRLPVNFFPCDISKNILPEFKKNDIVVHLAARQYHTKIPKKNRLDWFEEVNTKGTENLLNNVYGKDIGGMIYMSSDMVYGYPKSIPIKNTHSKKPLGPYGKSKLKAENLLLKAQKNGMPLTILRPRLIMGPGRLGIMERLFSSISHNKTVPIIGKGKNYYQMVSVDDCSDAIILSIKNKFPPKSLNLGSNPELNVSELLKKLIIEVKSKSTLFPLPPTLTKFALNLLDLSGFSVLYPEQFKIADKNYIVDISDTYSTIKWKPKYSDIDMLISAYKYWKTNI